MIGEVRMLQGQRYECKAIEPYTRKDGVQSSIALWATHCATCGQPFELATALNVWSYKSPKVLRRCAEHRRCGLRVVDEGRKTKNLRIQQTGTCRSSRS
jgi:hypothetical protein